jgi:hypothetical protein
MAVGSLGAFCSFPEPTMCDRSTTAMVPSSQTTTDSGLRQQHVEQLDERIVAVLTRLDLCRRQGVRRRVEQQNERHALEAQLMQAQGAFGEQFQGLTLQKSKRSSCRTTGTTRPSAALDLSVYRQAIVSAFGSSTYLPAFCLTQQTSLLRAMHCMICAEQAVETLHAHVAAELRAHNHLVSTNQEETAMICQTILTDLIQTESKIKLLQRELDERQQRLHRLCSRIASMDDLESSSGTP